jgi:hypothetical protein
VPNGGVTNKRLPGHRFIQPDTVWPAFGGGGPSAYAAILGRPYIVEVHFQSQYGSTSKQWRLDSNSGGEVWELSSTERALVKTAALQAMQAAYQDYNVTFTISDTMTRNPSAPRHIYVTETIDPDVIMSGAIAPAGFTPPLAPKSDVYFPNLWSTLKSVLECHTQSLDACLQTKGRSREQMLRALGTGIGNTAAHELGHQPPYYFTAHLKNCPLGCYDSESAVSLAHFFGPMHWSPFATNKMKPLRK